MTLLLATLFLAGMVEARIPEPDDLDPIVIINGKLAATPTFGAGIIFSREKDAIYVVTANHVVRSAGTAATQLTIELHNAPGKKLRAELTEHFDAALDLAVVSVHNPTAQGVDMCGVSLVEQLAPLGSEERGDSVFPLGDPNGEAWALPVRPDAISEIRDGEITFESSLIAKGDSGGGLLNDHGGFVGLIQADEPPYGRALSLDKVLKVLKDWKYSVDLEAPDEDNEGNPPIFSAVANGRIEEVKRWLARPCADVNIRGVRGRSLIIDSTDIGDPAKRFAIMRLLVGNGANLKADGLEFLLEYVNDADETRFLLSHGASCIDALEDAAERSGLERFKAVMQGCHSDQELLNRALIAAVRSETKRPAEEDAAILTALIQAGAQVNAIVDGYGGPYYALREAVYSNKVWRAKVLIAAGAQLETPYGTKETEEASDLLYRLLFVWDRPDFAIAEFLIAHGADVNERSIRGKLDLARSQHRQDVVDFLVQHGAKEDH
jgi:Trypsin-like peptidase domain